MSSRTRSLNPRSVASVLTKFTQDISREGKDTVKVGAPEGIVADLFPHFTWAPGHVFEECFRRQVGDPEQDFPDPVSQRRVLNVDEQRNGGKVKPTGMRTVLEGIPSMRMSRRSFFTFSSTDESFGCERILLKA
jgi:hypothetical protein